MTPHENDLHARLEDLADAAGSWPDPLPGVLERAHGGDRRVAPVGSIRSRRRTRLIMLSAAAATIVVLGAVVWIFNPFAATPSGTTASAPGQQSSGQDDALKENAPGAAGGGGDAAAAPALPSCGAVPTQSGPLADITTLTLSAPPTGKAGASVTVDARLTATADGPSLTTGLPLPDVVVVQEGRIVGRFDGVVPMIALSIPVTAGMDVPVPGSDQSPAQSPPEVQLSGCAAQDSTGANSVPNSAPAGPAERPALPAGQYQLVAMIDYSVDTPGAGNPDSATGTLVSAPVPITVVS